MSEQTQQQGSPLESDRGNTTISESVVSTLASRVADEVDGIYLGGDPSGGTGLVGRIRGSSQGISVQVGRTEVVLDLTLGIDYGMSIAQTVEQLRRGITEEIENTTGLRVRELNTTITDIVFSDRQVQQLEEAEDPTQTTPEDQAEDTPDGEQTTELSSEDTEEPRVR